MNQIEIPFKDQKLVIETFPSGLIKNVDELVDQFGPRILAEILKSDEVALGVNMRPILIALITSVTSPVNVDMNVEESLRAASEVMSSASVEADHATKRADHEREN